MCKSRVFLTQLALGLLVVLGCPKTAFADTEIYQSQNVESILNLKADAGVTYQWVPNTNPEVRHSFEGLLLEGSGQWDNSFSVPSDDASTHYGINLHPNARFEIHLGPTDPDSSSIQSYEFETHPISLFEIKIKSLSEETHRSNLLIEAAEREKKKIEQKIMPLSNAMNENINNPEKYDALRSEISFYELELAQIKVWSEKLKTELEKQHAPVDLSLSEQLDFSTPEELAFELENQFKKLSNSKQKNFAFTTENQFQFITPGFLLSQNKLTGVQKDQLEVDLINYDIKHRLPVNKDLEMDLCASFSPVALTYGQTEVQTPSASSSTQNMMFKSVLTMCAGIGNVEIGQIHVNGKLGSQVLSNFEDHTYHVNTGAGLSMEQIADTPVGVSADYDYSKDTIQNQTREIHQATLKANVAF